MNGGYDSTIPFRKGFLEGLESVKFVSFLSLSLYLHSQINFELFEANGYFQINGKTMLQELMNFDIFEGAQILEGNCIVINRVKYKFVKGSLTPSKFKQGKENFCFL